jgi:hypothetical protein
MDRAYSSAPRGYPGDQHVRLKAGYLTGGRSVPINGTPSDYVTHDRIDPQPFGIVYIFLSRQAEGAT